MTRTQGAASVVSVVGVLSVLVLGVPTPASPAGAMHTGKDRVITRDVGPELGVNWSIEGFLVHPQDPRQVLGATIGSGISKSRNGGHTWDRSNAGFVGAGGILASVSFGLRADPHHPSTVYALSWDGLYRSTDFGDTWSRLGSEDMLYIVDVAVHPTEPGVLFALSDDAVLWKSTDGGVTFEPFGLGFPDDPAGFGFLNLVIVPSEPTTMYVAQHAFSPPPFPVNEWALYKSTDGGVIWALIPSPPFPLQVFPDPTNSGTLYLQAFAGSTGLFKSTDGGTTFEELTGGLPGEKVNFVGLDPRRPSDVYAGFKSGLFRSTDGGRSFAKLGLEPEQVGNFVGTFSVDPTDSRVLYVNTGEGNFKSVNGGHNFFPISRGWTVASVRAIAFDHRPDPRLFVATQADFGGRLLRTASDGSHYTELTRGLPNPVFVDAIAASVTGPDLVVIATNRGLFRSTDGGRSWTAALVDTGQTRFTFAIIAIDPGDSANVYVTCTLPPSPGLYRSRDGGRTFARATALPGTLRAESLAVDPQHPSVIYVGARIEGRVAAPGLFKSTDGGETFTAILTTRNSVLRQIVVDPKNTQNLYITEFRFSFRLLRSTDGGATFTEVQSGLQGDLLYGVLIDPEDSSTLFAWMRGGGLFATHDGATTWTRVDEGEALLRSGTDSTSNMSAMAIDPKRPDRIYLGGASVLELKIR